MNSQDGPVIKICGLFREEDAGFVNEAGPDYAGFVFAPSRRQVSPEKAARIRERLKPGILPVGVFVRAPAEEIAALYRDGVIALAQLHGGEDRAYIAALRALCPVPLIQVIPCGDGAAQTGGQSLIAGEADYLLFDNAAAGSGRTFDWNILQRFGSEIAVIMGGLGGQRLTAFAVNQKPRARSAIAKAIAPVWADCGKRGATPCHIFGQRPAGAEIGRGRCGGGAPAEGVAENRRFGARGRLPPSYSPVPSPQSPVPPKKWFIAGGIDDTNIEKALALKPYGVDVSSGAESGGVKDRDKILRLVEIVRRWGGKA